jgi:hypothetical protein
MAQGKTVETDMLRIQNQLKAALQNHQVLFRLYFALEIFLISVAQGSIHRDKVE